MPASRPEQLLAEWETLGLSLNAPPRVLRKLPGGRTNETYLIDADGDRLVLRINTPQSLALGIDRDREQRIVSAAADAGLAPPVVCADPGRGFMLSVFVAGEPGRVGSLNGPRLASMLALLAAVRQLEVAVQAMDYHRYALHLLSPASLDQRLEDAVRLRIELLEAETPVGLCHHDLVPSNVLFGGGGALFIDWEYAGLGRPILDLASLVIEWNVAVEAISEASGTDLELLLEACALYRDLCALWELRQRVLTAGV